MLRKTVAIILAIMMLFTISISAFEGNKVDQEPLRGEYLRKYILNLDELYALKDFTESYYRSLTSEDTSSLEEFVGDRIVNGVVKAVFGVEVYALVAGLRELFRIARNEELRALREATSSGIDAIEYAIRGYRDTEDMINREVIEAEIEFSVYTRWQYRDVVFIQGGGYIKRVHVRSGWISGGAINVLFKKKKEELLKYEK